MQCLIFVRCFKSVPHSIVCMKCPVAEHTGVDTHSHRRNFQDSEGFSQLQGVALEPSLPESFCVKFSLVRGDRWDFRIETVSLLQYNFQSCFSTFLHPRTGVLSLPFFSCKNQNLFQLLTEKKEFSKGIIVSYTKSQV